MARLDPLIERLFSEAASELRLDAGAGVALLELVKKKVVEPKEAWMKAVGKAELRGMLEGSGIELELGA